MASRAPSSVTRLLWTDEYINADFNGVRTTVHSSGNPSGTDTLSGTST